MKILAANNHPVRRNATDLGSTSAIDWTAVDRQAGEFLSPEQTRVLQRFGQCDAQR